MQCEYLSFDVMERWIVGRMETVLYYNERDFKFLRLPNLAGFNFFFVIFILLFVFVLSILCTIHNKCQMKNVLLLLYLFYAAILSYFLGVICIPPFQ